MENFRPWDGTVRILTGGWTAHPVSRGEQFDDCELLPALRFARYHRIVAVFTLLLMGLLKPVIR
jgi:hypothetical protein